MGWDRTGRHGRHASQCYARPPMEAPAEPPNGILATHLRNLVEALSRGLIEREQTVRVALLAALAGENVLLLGPPGTAKSLIARRLALAFQECRSFQYLLTRFTTPDELFGPVSLRELKENDAFRRKTEGYLPAAEVAFLDEIFKASSAILNALLTLINERLFFNGSEILQVPLLVLVAASNETPEDESLLALFDRFSVRLVVERISTEQGFLTMIASTEREESVLSGAFPLTPQSVLLIRKASQDVRLPPGVQQLIARVRAGLNGLGQEEQEGRPEEAYRFYVSDRRWRQAVRLLRTSAYVHGRDEVDEVDCALLQHCLWNRPEDVERIQELLDRVFEDFQVAFELRLEPIARRWWELLQDMRNHPGVAEPIYSGHTVESSAGSQCFHVTDRELEDWRGNDPAWIFKSGIAFDSRGHCFRPVSKYSDGSLRTHGNTRLPDEAALRRSLQQGEMLMLEEASVAKVSRRKQRGVVLRFEQVHPAVHRHWAEEAQKLEQELAAQTEAREVARRKLDTRISSHLFVQSEQVRGLKLGLAHAGLVLDEWQRKMTDLRGALMARGQFATVDIDHAPPPGEGTEPWKRLLGPTVERAAGPEQPGRTQ